MSMIQGRSIKVLQQHSARGSTMSNLSVSLETAEEYEQEDEEEESAALLFNTQSYEAQEPIVDHRRPRSSHLSTSSEEKSKDPEDKTNNATEKEEEPPRKTSRMVKFCSYIQCVPDSDEKDQELDPFGPRRLAFTVIVVIIAILANLVIIPIALTNMEERNKAMPSAVPSSTPTETPQPTSSNKPSLLPSKGPSFSPTYQGQTREPTPEQTSEKPTTPRPTNPPFQTPVMTRPPQPTPPTEAVAVPLPPYTLAALNDPDSPQSLAFQWLNNDPHLASYSTSRTLQRMSLATFFFATNEKIFFPEEQRTTDTGVDPDVFDKLFDGDRNYHIAWTNASNWLSYDIHECFWFSQAPYVCDAQQTYRFLTLNHNGLVGRLPPELGLLTQLEQVQLSDNLQLYGSIPTHIRALRQLRSLQLNQLPQLSGTIPWTSLHVSLQTLHLRETPYVAKLIDPSVGRLTRLQELLLDTRAMEPAVTSRQGTIPTQLGHCRALRALAVTGDELRGTLPDRLANLRQLQSLSICHTQISGQIPAALGHNLSRLQRLELTHNRLSRSLPKELGLLRSTLTSLALNDNRLESTIPFQYSNLTKCRSMAFQHNRLTGTVPLGLCYLRTEGVIQTLAVDCNDRDTVSGNPSPLECSCDCDCY